MHTNTRPMCLCRPHAPACLPVLCVFVFHAQILGRCIASANSPLDTVRRGVQQWIDLGVTPSKLILGLPWYGYDYPCQQQPHADVDVCMLASVPFRGVLFIPVKESMQLFLCHV